MTSLELRKFESYTHLYCVTMACGIMAISISKKATYSLYCVFTPKVLWFYVWPRGNFTGGLEITLVHPWCNQPVWLANNISALIARSMGPTWGSFGADRTHVGPMLAPWTLLSGGFVLYSSHSQFRIRLEWLIGSISHSISLCKNSIIYRFSESKDCTMRSSALWFYEVCSTNYINGNYLNCGERNLSL